jgi:threonine dehydrogenase-like Zn-dependent dehydrogenase
MYGGLLDMIPLGIRHQPRPYLPLAQTPVQHYLPRLLERIEKGEIDPAFVITHRATLEEGPELNKTFWAKQTAALRLLSSLEHL